MRYHYESTLKMATHGQVYECDHELYNKCTLYYDDGIGLAVIQQRFNPDLKMMWWGPIDIGLVDDIYDSPGFKEYFKKYAACKDENGIYPTIKVRKLMWALRMKPLKKQHWELA